MELKFNTIISFGSAQLEEFNIPEKHRRDGVILITPLVEAVARDLMFKTPGIGSNFCTSYNYDKMILTFEDNGSHAYTYEELMLLRKDN